MSTPGIIQKIIKRNSDPKLIQKALEFAKAAHQGQKRHSGEDYIQHPIRVAQILQKMKLDPQTIAAGLLHDVADDTEKTLEDIEKEFGKEIAFLVSGVSKLGKLRYPQENVEIKSLEQRTVEPIDLKAENLRKMFFAMGEDLRVVLIKLADRLHNMETLDSLPPEKQKRIALETLEIFAPLADRLGMGEMRIELEGLAFPYLYPKEYDWLMNNVKERYEERKRYLEKVQPVLRKILKKERVKILDMHSRAKSYWSLYQKLLRYDMNFDKIYDLVALRIIVKDIASCYKTLGIIHKQWKPLPEKIHDFIALPKPNGYQGLHTTVFCMDGKITEFQIKTQAMHEEAENGICAHWAYKQGIDLASQKNKFNWVKQLRDWQKEVSQSKEFLETLKIDFFKNRIFVFTPKGDVIDLPEGATPVDFAYNVHTEIGHKCAGAKVNGKIVALSQPLKKGDMVEIIVDKNKKPSRDWLEFVKTSVARSRIKGWLKQEYGEILPPKTTKKDWERPPQQEKPRPRLKLKKQTKGTRVALAGQKGMQVFLAKCCLPQPGQQVKAYITRNRGASIHKENCINLIRAQQKWPYKVIEATWEEE